MFRSIAINLKRATVGDNFLYSNLLNNSIRKRFECTDNSEQINNNENSSFDELKRYREAEVKLWYSLGYIRVDPNKFTKEQWHQIYTLDAKHQRKRFCRYLSCREEAIAEKREKKKAEQKSKEGNRERVRAEREANQHLVYGLGRNSLLLRINTQTMTKWMNMKLHRSKMYGQKVVIDCSYEKFMTLQEQSKTTKGIKQVYAENRKHLKPFDLHICGVKENSAIIKNLSRQIPSLLKTGSPTYIGSECFTELFPKDRLVMLTPDSDNVFQYNADDIYVVGGIVDFGRNDPLTLAKAKKLGIRSARLPLDNLRLKEGDTRELSMSRAIAIVRECQLSNEIDAIIKKCYTLKSDRKNDK